jgi:hypothetical protein
LLSCRKSFDLLKVKNDILSSYEKWVEDTSEIASDVYSTMLALFNTFAELTVYADDAENAAVVTLTGGDYFTGAKLAEVYRLSQILQAQYTYRAAELGALTTQESSSKASMDSKSSEITGLSANEATALRNLSTPPPRGRP